MSEKRVEVPLIETDIVAHVSRVGGVLVHQVNNRRAAGRGLAAQIARQWPEWYAAFRIHPPHPTPPQLGHAWLMEMVPPSIHCAHGVWVASLYAQDGYGTDRIYTDLGLLRASLRSLVVILGRYGATPPPIFVPYNMGCGLGGEEWENVLPILYSEIPFPWTICALP